MSKEELARAAEGSLDAWQREEIAKRDAIRLRLMVHGGSVDHSERLRDGLTKREQIRARLQQLPFVQEALFATAPHLEAQLFDACDGTVLLIERDARQKGARYELVLHSGQSDVPKKLFVFIPDGDRVPELEGEGFFPALVRDRVKPVHKLRYSDRDYDDCHLVEKAIDFAESILIDRAESIASPPPDLP